MKKIIAVVCVGMLLVMAVSACASNTGSGLQISDVWARTVNMGAMDSSGSGDMAQQTGAVYMNISNGGAADKLLKAETDVAQAAELHTVAMDNGVMQMRPVAGIDVPANGSVQLKPGGFHVMLIGVKKQLIPGDKITVKLTFEKAGEREIQAELRAQ